MKEDKEYCEPDMTPTNVKCPMCGKGTLEIAKGRFGPVWKCNADIKPKCKCYTESRPTGKHCTSLRTGDKKCGAPIVEGTKTIPDRCSDKTCPNRNPHKLNK